ncbi:hypothetical protein BDW72DRAFT_175412 [Aspergillus terricola var. indicus]
MKPRAFDAVTAKLNDITMTIRSAASRKQRGRERAIKQTERRLQGNVRTGKFGYEDNTEPRLIF